MTLCSLSLIALLISTFIYFIGFKLFSFYGILDNPKKYGYKREPVPYSMGIWSVFSFVVLMMLFVDISWQVGTILSAVLILGSVCFLDDRYQLNALFRLVVQFLVAGLVVFGGTKIDVITNPLNFEIINLGWLSVILSVIWLVSLTNLINFLDGVSGLSSGVSTIGFFVLFALSVLPGMHSVDQSLVQYVSLILCCITFVAFIFEFPSPTFLLGDSGTMFFGFMLGVVSMLNGGKLATAALVLLIPLFDGMWVLGRRFWSKQSLFQGDFKHLHHRLERIGVSKEKILFGYLGVSLIFGLIAVFVWNTLFKVLSLIVLLLALSLTGYLVWTQEKK